VLRSAVVICPGCGWRGSVADLSSGACPNCGYENNQAPYFRLLTIGETLLAEVGAATWKDVDVPAYCQALLATLGKGNAELMQHYGEPEPVAPLHTGDRVRFIGDSMSDDEAEVDRVDPNGWLLLTLKDGVTKWLAQRSEVEKIA